MTVTTGAAPGTPAGVPPEDLVTLTIDGIEISVPKGTLVIRAAELLGIELDLFWAIKAGQDAKALIRRLPGRVYAYHVKDMTAEGAMTSVGKGVIDFADIFTLNDMAGVRHLYVENDQSPAPYLPDITTSFTTLSRLGA